MIARIDVVHLTGNPGGKIRQKVEPGTANLVDADIALKRRVVFVPLEDIAEVADARCSQGLDGPGRYRVHADVALPEVCGEIAHTGFQRRLGNAHDVVMGHDPFGTVIGQGDQAPAFIEKRRRALRNRRKGVTGDIQASDEIGPRGVEVLALQLLLVGIGNGVNHEIQASPFLANGLEHAVDAGIIGNIAGHNQARAYRIRKGADAAFQGLSLIGKS